MLEKRSQFAGNEELDVQWELPRRKLDVGGRSSGGRLDQK